MPESIRPRVLHLVGIALIFVTAEEQRASVAVMRSLPSGGDLEEHTARRLSNNVTDLKTVRPGPHFSKG